MTTVCVEVWGPHAQSFAQRRAGVRIAAVFARSLHLEADGDFLCLGDPSIGRGPLNAVVSPGSWARLGAAIPAAGGSARIDRGSIRIGAAAIDASAATLWRPGPLPGATSRDRVADAVGQLAHLSSARAPDDGLARIVLVPAARPGPALARVARPRIERLRAWLGDCLVRTAYEIPPVELLGLGPGLTPSGDDVLCGTLVALRAVGWNEPADHLARAIDRAAPIATSPLSRAFLRAAAQGLGAAPLHETISGLLSGHTEGLDPPLRALGRIGHTSGWDALAGAVLVLQAYSTIAVQHRGVASPELSL
jgi:hypothetical protein